jgi:hypothetical protein
MPGIALVAYFARTEAVESMMRDAMIKVKKVDSVAASNILFLFQTTYVLRMNKHSEKMTDATPRPVPIIPNTWHLFELSFEVKFKYRFTERMIKGRYRVTIYMHFTLLHCDRSKNVHSS